MAAKVPDPTDDLFEAVDSDIRDLVMTHAEAPRLRQDAPVQADVWFAFAASRGRPVSLLLVPYRDMPAGEAATRLRDAAKRHKFKAEVASVQGVVAVSLTFEALLGCVLPATKWWNELEVGSAPYNWLKQIATLLRAADAVPPPGGRDIKPFVGFVSTDRPMRTAASYSLASCATVKADAAKHLFGIACDKITWAVLDTGIDGTHPAFRDHGATSTKASRVVQTYDFVGLLGRISQIVNSPGRTDLKVRAAAALHVLKPDLQGPALEGAIDVYFSQLRKRLRAGRDLDWQLFEPFVLVADPAPPKVEHGTAVAGIIAADWRSVGGNEDPPDGQQMVGMCPDIRLIDVRVVPDEEGEAASEFDVIAALQFLRFLNDRSGAKRTEVHGANLSLATPHDVRNYACGATLVCLECDRLTANGVVVVVAAGNGGHSDDPGNAGSGVGGRYSAISIADPGNAQSVITVGSTHSREPHRYGVSWFSGRGPTGDGRMKPDLIAPGERIVAPLLDRGASRELNGTSFAAPHVSGAAALLMARHDELVAKPARIKDILCRSATDLGRERTFQGAGLLDVLRALQNP